MIIFNYRKKGRYSPYNSTSLVITKKTFFVKSKITKLNPAYKMSGVKKNVIYSLSENKKINLTAMP